MSQASSNLRVFVKFKEDTVFAGEDVECTITFKNVQVRKPRSPGTQTPQPDTNTRRIDPLEHLKAARTPSQGPSRKPSVASRGPQPPNPTRRPSQHRQTSSLSVVESAEQQNSPITPDAGFQVQDAPSDRKHGRRVSIVSLGGAGGPQRPSNKHGRASSTQLSISSFANNRQKPSTGAQRSLPQQSPRISTLTSPTTTPETVHSPKFRPPHARAATVQTADLRQPTKGDTHLNSPSTNSRRLSLTSLEQFSFPSQPPTSSQDPNSPSSPRPAHPIRTDSLKTKTPPLPNGRLPDGERPTQISQVFSVQSMEGTPRSSADFYAASNHSDETLVSDNFTQQTTRLLKLPQLGRASAGTKNLPPSGPETIMMGYAQLSGSFSLDGSLVNSSPFEEVKRKAVVGGQGGGGVVGISQNSSNSGLFGSFNWNNIGESIGGIIGGSNMSSFKEMKGVVDANTIPLLSTSKSILFVDLRLEPGESRSYSYKFRVPRGLPPSHRGRAMKVTYNLVIGAQRPASNRSQNQLVKSVEIPFRVLGGVNEQGQCLGHDLMSPYIVLKDEAQTMSLDSPGATPKPDTSRMLFKEKDPSSSNDFQSYVNYLLSRPRTNSSSGLLSPTAEPPSPESTKQMFNSPQASSPQPSVRNLIDHAIRSCTNPSSPNYSPNNFTIARASVPIASLTLSRPALKLGDSITCAIDFARAKLPCYTVQTTLESSEKVDQSLAIRNPQSIERVTRKIWARQVDNAIWARRCIFNAQIPSAATPGFTTTGVNLDWCIRLELVVGMPTRQGKEGEESRFDTNPHGWDEWQAASRLLDITNEDERGTVLEAKQRLLCDSFEVTIPIKVFGATVGGSEETEELEGWAI